LVNLVGDASPLNQIDVKAAQEIEEVRLKTDKIMDLLLRDVEFRELLKKKLKELEYS
jgi:hypothetical protein